MISNSEEANMYYQLVNQYIDEYTETHKIKPANVGKYLKNNSKLVRFMERKGLKDVKNVNQVINDVIEDRISMEKDLVRTFESFKFFESDEFKVLNLRQCLYKGISKSSIEHEKILADHFDVSLSQIDVINSDKHIFKINDFECVIYKQEELLIIKENIKEYCFDQVFNKKVKLEGIGIDLDVNVKDFIDKDKFESHVDGVLSSNNIILIVKVLLSCDKVENVGKYTREAFIGIEPSHY